MDHGPVSKEIAKGLKELQDRISAANIPSSKLDETVNIATWNIREFGKRRRSGAAIHYIAEILGPYWHAVYSDAIVDPGGNRERIAFVYDQRAATFQGLAAEASPPRTKKGTEYLPALSWWRSPYMAAFRAGSFDFVVFAVHVRWGDSIDARKQEIQSITEWLDGKRKETDCEDKDIIVMGDFNIESRSDDLFKTITSKGLEIPKALVQLDFGSNLAKDKRYDQILHYPLYPENFTNRGGVLDFYTGGISSLFKGLSKEEFTYQMSDHLPLWMQMNTDIAGFKLDQIIQG